jgi:primosomal protein N' (replication factor Y)
MQGTPSTFIQVILPLPVPKAFTYFVPSEWQHSVQRGVRVIVPFGKQKLYAGIVLETHTAAPTTYQAKHIEDVLDDAPIVLDNQLNFWQWIADYYLCNLGDVMSAALPSALQLHSESKLILNQPFEEINDDELTDREYLICEALEAQEILSIADVSAILGIKTVHPIIRSLLAKGIVILEEEVKEQYKPKTIWMVSLAEEYQTESALSDVMNQLARAPKQTALLMRFVEMSGFFSGSLSPVPKVTLQKKADASSSQLKSLVDKGIFVLDEQEISRLETIEASSERKQLNADQQKCYELLKEELPKHPASLLYGVTSSGKTEVYIELIHDYIQEGKQVLYLLPEIALTTQIIKRLQAQFGGDVGVYHSRFNQQERTEVWNNMLLGKYKVVLGARSAIFLPFQDLGLIIVDEEHEASFKQFDPAPRYHARDAAIVLGQQNEAQVLLGSATPSVESFYQAQQGKYGFASLLKRFGGVELPRIELADLREEQKKKTMKSHFSSLLIQKLEQTISTGKQAILFQNRRGFSPYIQCTTCGWTPSCTRCDVNLTYHKHIERLKCHYCGYNRQMPGNCDQCGSPTLELKGFGTEKIEDELHLMYPHWKIKRLDLDTTRGKHAFDEILTSFQQQEIDVLVGTQMVTKGLDFENVSLVGVMNADAMLNFPDFRAHERSFQLMAQVAGRAGRKKDQGEVVIQTYQPDHPIVQLVSQTDYTGFYKRQVAERLQFQYPPYYRMIKFTIIHVHRELVNDAANELAILLRKHFDKRVLGPEYPLIARIKNRYHKQIMLKLPREASSRKVRFQIQQCIDHLQRHPEYRKVRVLPDVDPN